MDRPLFTKLSDQTQKRVKSAIQLMVLRLNLQQITTGKCKYLVPHWALSAITRRKSATNTIIGGTPGFSGYTYPILGSFHIPLAIFSCYKWNMTLQRKILLWAILPLVLAMLGIGALIYNQSSELSRQQTATLERGLIHAKKAELRYYTAFARNSIANIYDKADRNDDKAKQQVKKILSKLSYGPDGYFFVYDYAGNSIVHPRQSFRVGKNWMDLKDPTGNFVIRNLIDAAKRGGGYTSYVWEKPSTGTLKKKIGYAIGLKKWGWMLGTGMYIDDITAQVSVLETGIVKKTTRTFLLILTIVILALAIVGGAGVFLTLQEHRNTRSQLKALNQRIVETQEHERTRVARELHDGISQQLSSTKYVFELAQIQQSRNNKTTGKTITRGIEALAGAIAEVRRISKDLRPGMLDDLGLAPALTSLAADFSRHTGIRTVTNINPVRSKLSDDGKTALFRIAQEAFNNIARHADASSVTVSLFTRKQQVTLIIADNGKGFQKHLPQHDNGIGLTNMAERVAYYDGSFDIKTSERGTKITARIATTEPTGNLKMAAE